MFPQRRRITHPDGCHRGGTDGRDEVDDPNEKQRQGRPGQRKMSLVQARKVWRVLVWAYAGKVIRRNESIKRTAIGSIDRH